MKREGIRRSTRKGQIQHKTSGAQKKKAKNQLTMKTKQDHQINIIYNNKIPINYYSNYTANSNQSITLFYIT